MVRDLVLVADDSEDNRMVLQVILEHAGFRVRVAVDGREAVEHARAYRPILIVMDLQMPVLDGWQATRLLKANPATAGVPVIAYTAEHRLSLEQLRQAGFCAYLRKPCGLVQVLAAVRRCLDDAAAGQAWTQLPEPDLRASLP